MPMAQYSVLPLGALKVYWMENQMGLVTTIEIRKQGVENEVRNSRIHRASFMKIAGYVTHTATDAPKDLPLAQS